MNNFTAYIHLAEYVAPAVASFSCAMFLLLSYGNCYTQREAILKKNAIFYMCASLFSWTAVCVYIFFPEVFVFIQAFLYLSFLYVYILFYRLFHILTGVNDKERFSVWHYIIPIIIFTVLTIWSFFVPYEIKLEITMGRGKVIPQGYEAYAYFFSSKVTVRFIYSAFYLTLTFLRLVKYYKRISSASSSTRWLLWLAILVTISIIVSTIGAFVRSEEAYFTFAMAIVAVLILAQNIFLTFALIRRSYAAYIVYPVPQEVQGAAKARKSYSRTSSNLLTRSKFNAYFKEHKPYLNPAFKITDLVEIMNINRSYISSFVNRTYGVNFNRYVNGLRLQELERLSVLVSNKNKALRELIKEAGFTDIKHYQRALKDKTE